MKLSKVPAVAETQNARDERVEQLWRKLDTDQKGEINLQELQKGLRKIDHPLKNAGDMLRDAVKAMDKNGDEVIQYDGMDLQENLHATSLRRLAASYILTNSFVLQNFELSWRKPKKSYSSSSKALIRIMIIDWIKMNCKLHSRKLDLLFQNLN